MQVAIYFHWNLHQGLSRLFTWQAVLGYPSPPSLHSTSITLSLSLSLTHTHTHTYIYIHTHTHTHVECYESIFMLLALCNSFINLKGNSDVFCSRACHLLHPFQVTIYSCPSILVSPLLLSLPMAQHFTWSWGQVYVFSLLLTL
jgi:hypothetical protein